MKTVLLIGQNGQVTTYLQKSLAESDLYKLVVAGRDQLDLMKVDQVQAALATLKPDVIINPAAYTAVDLAEQETAAAFCINRDAVAEIAQFCAASSIPLIQFSTDYVFAGDASSPYSESDVTQPTGVYGQSKLEGEQAILESGAPAIILRTAWVYSNSGKNFYKTMLSLAESRTELSVVADQIGSPTFAGSIAQATKELLNIIIAQGGLKEEQRGVFHFTCQGHTSWCDFAKALFAENAIVNMNVQGITTEQYPTPAKRPGYSVLDGAKLQTVFGVALPDWQDALRDCVLEKKVEPTTEST